MVPFRPRPGRIARPVRRRLPRRALPWWAATLALAVATGLVADGLLQRATDAEARWGTTRTVLVATSALGPGRRARRAHRGPPASRASAVPEGAVAGAGAGAVAVDAIGAGEVVTEARVGGPGAAGLAGPTAARHPRRARPARGARPAGAGGRPRRPARRHLPPTRPWPGPRRSSRSAARRARRRRCPHRRRRRWPRPSDRARSSPPS